MRARLSASRVARSVWMMTPAEQAAARNSLTVFFGALLGAQLGLFGALPLESFVISISVLAGAVMALQMVAHARSRLYALAMVAMYAVILAAAYLTRVHTFPGVPVDGLNRIFATLAVWLGSVLITELTPTFDPLDRPQEDRG